MPRPPSLQFPAVDALPGQQTGAKVLQVAITPAGGTPGPGQRPFVPASMFAETVTPAIESGPAAGTQQRLPGAGEVLQFMLQHCGDAPHQQRCKIALEPKLGKLLKQQPATLPLKINQFV